MKELTAALAQIEAGTYTGIGSQMVALGADIRAPEGITKPPRDGGLGWAGKYLGYTARETARDLPLQPLSPTENGKIVDKRLLAWLLIGREYNDKLGSENFIFAAEDLVQRALQTTAEIAQAKVVQGAKRTATDWRSLFEGLTKADIFGEEFQPAIITSLGGWDGEVPLAAPFNVVPGLELCQLLRARGYDPTMVVTSAAKYGADCNGLDLGAVSKNWTDTYGAYQTLASAFYPEAEGAIAYETLVPGGLDTYPPELFDAARAACNADKSLQQTAAQYSADPEAFVRYMLSHTQAFRDFQTAPELPFVIKVGAPSELRFSQWQKRVIEQALPDLPGFIPNMVRPSDGQYGQISLYYPRIGNRPPYYPDSADEPGLCAAQPGNYTDFLYSLPNDSPSLARYADLESALETTSIAPNEYLALFSGGDNE
ncbi:MAG TPA: hypothetical protein VJP80_06295 [Candidatus Saccharimonadales bacterium]|nr:hypothetical protein [Candidatus Saccharimonadales bacterium]